MNDRWLRLSLRAYPRRFRAAKTAEVVGAAAEAAAAGDAEFISGRALIGLVLAGWMVRWREHPPLGVWLRYVFGSGRIDTRWHAWMLDDLDGWSVERSWGSVMWLLLGCSAALGFALHQPPPGWFWVLHVGAPLLLGRLPFIRRWHRRKVLLANRFDPATRHWLAPAIPPWLLTRPPKHLRASIVLYPLGTAFTIALAVFAARWWLPSLQFRTVESDGTTHAVGDISALVGRMSTLMAGGLAVMSAATAGRSEPWLKPMPGVARATRTEKVVIFVAALVLALVPLFPLVPTTIAIMMPPVLAAGPMLLVLGRMAQRMERATGEPVVLTRPARARSVRT